VSRRPLDSAYWDAAQRAADTNIEALVASIALDILQAT
jgi:hypothetical protein